MISCWSRLSQNSYWSLFNWITKNRDFQNSIAGPTLPTDSLSSTNSILRLRSIESNSAKRPNKSFREYTGRWHQTTCQCSPLSQRRKISLSLWAFYLPLTITDSLVMLVHRLLICKERGCIENSFKTRKMKDYDAFRTVIKWDMRLNKEKFLQSNKPKKRKRGSLDLRPCFPTLAILCSSCSCLIRYLHHPIYI